MPVITKVVEVPGDDGLRVTIRKLSYWQVRNAKKAFLEDAIEQGRMMGDLQEKFAEARRKANEDAARQAVERGEPLPPKVEDDPATFYDQRLTLHYGIVAWSYAEEVSDANIDDLLGPSEADFIHAEIVAFTERSADEKKGSAEPSPRISELAEARGPTN